MGSSSLEDLPPARTHARPLSPDKPLDGSGSRSDWMGSAGDLSREAAPACSHAQLNTHSAARSARRSSIPHLGSRLRRAVPANTPKSLRSAETGSGVYPKWGSSLPGRVQPGPDSARRSLRAFPQHQQSPRSLVPLLFYSPLP